MLVKCEWNGKFVTIKDCNGNDIKYAVVPTKIEYQKYTDRHPQTVIDIDNVGVTEKKWCGMLNTTFGNQHISLLEDDILK